MWGWERIPGNNKGNKNPPSGPGFLSAFSEQGQFLSPSLCCACCLFDVKGVGGGKGGDGQKGHLAGGWFGFEGLSVLLCSENQGQLSYGNTLNGDVFTSAPLPEISPCGLVALLPIHTLLSLCPGQLSLPCPAWVRVLLR